jgi:hypothetical protein
MVSERLLQGCRDAVEWFWIGCCRVAEMLQNGFGEAAAGFAEMLQNCFGEAAAGLQRCCRVAEMLQNCFGEAAAGFQRWCRIVLERLLQGCRDAA